MTVTCITTATNVGVISQDLVCDDVLVGRGQRRDRWRMGPSRGNDLNTVEAQS